MRRSLLILSAQVLLMTGLWMGRGAAQDMTQQPTNTPQVSPARPQYQGSEGSVVAAFEGKIPAEKLKFLRDYALEPKKKVTKEKQFNALLKAVTPKTTYHYGKDMSLSDTVDLLLHSGKAGVTVLKERYAMVAGSEGPYLGGRVFLWVDMEDGVVLGGVFFRPTNGEPRPTLAIFSNQLRVSELKMSQLPAEFTAAVRTWSAELNVPAITTRYFIPQNGRKYLLEHDEELCSGEMSRIATDENACLRRKVKAAETDVEAAAFITRTHNAANATAWMLNGLDVEQVDWMEQRKKVCGTGAGNLECWLRMTHERTAQLVAKRRQ